MNTKWIKISRDFDFNEMDTPDDIGRESVKYWIKCIAIGNKHQSMTGNYYELLNYEVFDRFLEPTELKEFNLTCKSLSDYYYGEYYLRVSLEDSNKEVRVKDFIGCQIQISLSKLIVFMKKYGSIKSWETIEIQEKYDDLRILYKELFDKHEKLKLGLE